MQVWLEDGRAYPAVAFEMSERGISAVTTSDLQLRFLPTSAPPNRAVT